MAGEIIRELVTLLGFKVDEKTISEYETKVNGAKVALRKLAWASAIAGGAIAGVAIKTIRAGSALVDGSKRLGMGVQALQEWIYAAEQAGVSADVFSEGIKYFGKSAAESTMGIGRARVAFARLAEYGLGKLTGPGGKLRDLSELLPESLYALSKMENPIERNALAMKMFGETGMQVVQMLDKGVDSIEQAREEFRRLNLGMSTETAHAAKAAGDAWMRFSKGLTAVVYKIGAVLLPAIESAYNWLAKWLGKHQTLAAVLGASALALAVFTAGVYALVAAKKVWLVVTLALNKAFSMLMLKVLAIAALIAAVFAVVYVIVEDLTYFFMDNGTDTITGRLVAGAKNLAGRAWDGIKAFLAKIPPFLYEQIDKIKTYWTEKWNDFLDLAGRLKDVLWNALLGFFELLKGMWNRIVNWMGAALDRVLVSMTPRAIREAWEMGEYARKGGAPGAASPFAAPASAGSSNEVHLTFNVGTPPGTTAQSVADEIVRKAAERLGLESLNVLGAR